MSRLGFKKVFQVATEAQLLDFMKNDPIQVIGWDQNTFKKELEEQKVFVVKAIRLLNSPRRWVSPLINWKQPSNATTSL